MKQMLLKCLAATGIALLISPAFAADSIKPTFQISIQPIGPAEAAAAVETPVTISKALRAKALFSNEALGATKGSARESDIIAINFTSAPVTVVVHDNATNTDIALNTPSRSSGRYGSIYFSPYRLVTVLNPNGAVVWQSNTVQSFDTISVYLSDGKYVVYDTQNN